MADTGAAATAASSAPAESSLVRGSDGCGIPVGYGEAGPGAMLAIAPAVLCHLLASGAL